MHEVTTWHHSRKGFIHGRIVEDTGEFVKIELASEHVLHLKSELADPYRDKGEIISVRKSFLSEVPRGS